MANFPINTGQASVDQALRMVEVSDPVHADVYNAMFEKLINNDAFLERLANKMIQQAMIAHVLDSSNKAMVLGADQGPEITKLIDKERKRVDEVNNNLAAKIYSSGNDLLVTRADDDSGIKYRLISSKSGLKLNKYVGDSGTTLWTAATNADLQNNLKIAIGSGTNCTIKFNNNPHDKCLLEFVGTNNGEYLYLVLNVTFSANAFVKEIIILKKDGSTNVNAVIENGAIKITGLNRYGVFEARVPKGFNIQ